MNRETKNHRYALSEELFQELHDLAKRLDRENSSCSCDGVFVPRVGKLYGEKDAPRIMFVGKATAGWGGDSKSLEDDWQATENFYDKLYNGEYKSQFWYYIRGLTREIYKEVGLNYENDIQWAVDRVIWSNLMKIGVNGSQPYGRLASEQRPMMKRILAYEMHNLRPDAIILCTNDYEAKLVEEVFGAQNAETIAYVGSDPIDSTLVEEIDAKLYWTRHPQGWAKNEAERIIAEDFGKWFKSKP